MRQAYIKLEAVTIEASFLLIDWKNSHSAITCSKLTIETLDQGVKCSKLTIKTPQRRHSRRSGVFIVNFEHISHLALVFLLLNLSR